MRAWLAALGGLLLLLAACFPAALAGTTALDGAARLTRIDALYEPLMPPGWRQKSDPSTETLHQPWDAWIMRTMRGGELPLWLPDNGFGAPVLANGQSAPFSPYKWLLLPWTDGAWSTAFVLGRLAIAGVGTLALAAAYGLSAPAGLLAAAAFMLHAYFVHDLRFPDVHVYMMLPWLMLAAERLRRRPDARGVGLMGLAIGVTGLLGHPEAALYSATTAGLAYAAMAVAAGEGVARRAGAMAAAIALAALLDMAVLLPFAEFVRDARTYLFEGRDFLGVTPKHVATFALAHLLIPNGPRFAYEHHVGIAPLALAALGLLAHRRGAAARPAAWLPGVVALGVGCLAYLLLPPGNVGPRLPLAPNSFYAAALVAMGLALLAGVGLDALLAAPRRRLGTLVGLGAAAVAVAAWRYQVAAPYKTLGDLAPALPFLLATAAVLVAQRLRPWPRPALAGVLLALTAANLMAAAWLVVVPLPPFRYPETPILARLKADPDAAPGRYRVAGGTLALRPDTNLLHGLTSAEHADAFYFRRYADYWDAASKDLPRAGYQPDLLDLACVRWLVVAQEPPGEGIPGLPPRGEGLRRQVAADPARFPLLATQRLAHLHENRGALPRARVLHAAAFVPFGSPEALARLTARPAAWREAALVETPDGRPFPGWVDRPGPATPAMVTAYAPRRVEVATTLDHPGVLVLADLFARGWQVEVDGTPGTIHPVDVAFRGVALGAGHHRVVFTYAPRSVSIGLALSLAGLALALLLLGRPRRERTSPPSC